MKTLPIPILVTVLGVFMSGITFRRFLGLLDGCFWLPFYTDGLCWQQDGRDHFGHPLLH